MTAGDWVQAVEQVTEEGFRGEDLWIHAEKGAVGHVLDVVDALWVNVYWERTGSVTVCHVEEITLLGGPDTGR